MQKITISFSTSWIFSLGYCEITPVDRLITSLRKKYQERLEILHKDHHTLSFNISDDSSKLEDIEESVKLVINDSNWKSYVQISWQDSPKSFEKSPTSTESVLEELSVSLEELINTFSKLEEGVTESPVESTEETKNPQSAHMDDLIAKYDDLYNTLTRNILGQDMAVMQFVRDCFQSELITKKDKKKPKSVFLFAGPPGVGKTYLAQTAAENMNVEYKVFNMSGYADEKAYIELIGISKGFKNPKEGDLVEFARKNPNGIIVFDEIEKAHLTTLRLFLQILDRGVLHNDFRGDDTDFSKNTLIFTSNVGKALYADRDKNLSSLPPEVILDALINEKTTKGEAVFPPELCSRFAAGNIVIFNHINVHTLLTIVRRAFNTVARQIEDEFGYRVRYSSKLPMLFLLNLGAKIDARIASTKGISFLTNEIYDLARHILPTDYTMAGVEEINFAMPNDLAPDIAPLFYPSEIVEILVLADEETEAMIDTSSEKYKVCCVKNIEAAKETLDRDISVIFVDPFYEIAQSRSKILGLDDNKSTGLEFINYLTESDIDIPIYLVSCNKRISDIDKKVFLQHGIRDIISGDAPITGEELNKQIASKTEAVTLQNCFTEFTSKGQMISYETAQVLSDDGKKLTVQFYDLKSKTAIDAESQNKIISSAERPDTKLSDVIGAANAKEELKYFLDFLKNPKKFLLNGGKRPKGLLLYGPPGTGKTMLARAMAGESSMTFIPTSATNLMSRYVGEGEKNIRDLFATAKRYAPAIIFIDEIDAIGKKRTGSEHTKSSEDMLNALLTEMDGFNSGSAKRPVFVLAATNYGVDEGSSNVTLDPALVRRFDNKIYVDLPNEEERKQYLELKLRGEELVSPDVISNFAKRATGKSLAILENVIDLAKRNSIKASAPLDDSFLQAALEEYSYGETHEWDKEYYRQVAIHEASHAYICYLSGEVPSFITIVSRGDFGGYMQHDSNEKQPNKTKTQLLWNIKTSLAGRIGEKVFFGEESAINTGASSDLEHATKLALRMICSLGMEEGALFSLNPDEILKTPLASEYINKANKLLVEQYAECEKLIEAGKDTIQAIADRLVADNYMTGEQLRRILNVG